MAKKYKIKKGTQRFDAGTIFDRIFLDTAKKVHVYFDHQNGVLLVESGEDVLTKANEDLVTDTIVAPLPEFEGLIE